MRYFYTASNQLKNLIRKFDVFSLSEHGLFDEQKNLLESLSDEYKRKVVCSEDNPNFITGRSWWCCNFLETNSGCFCLSIGYRQ